jgi:hypothetical protein
MEFGQVASGRLCGGLFAAMGLVKFLARQCNKLSYAHMSIFGRV